VYIASHPRPPRFPPIRLPASLQFESLVFLPTEHRPLNIGDPTQTWCGDPACPDPVGDPVGTAPSSFKSFSCNTYGSPRKCCKQKTYSMAKPFKCNTYKKQGGTPFKPKLLLFPSLSRRFDVQTFRRFRHSAPRGRRIRYLSRGSASSVLLDSARLCAKLYPGHSSVVSDCVGGCDG